VFSIEEFHKALETLSPKDEFELYHRYDVDFRTSTLYLGSGEEDDEIDWLSADRVIKNLTILDRYEHDITIKLNSPGGCVYNGLAIYDAILSCKNHVTVVVCGRAMSIASVIAQAADLRLMQKNASMMIHYGHLVSEGSSKEVYKEVEENKRLDKVVEDIYLKKIKTKKSRFSRKKLEEMMKYDCYMPASHCLKWGLIDKIV
jgi:ATP-dependent Clp endopeptidase proteolytic subunit ClpP